MRVGLFGGSFNPVHLGHLRAAEEDREAMGLDLIYFVPAASPPQKPPIGLAPAEHRLQMVRLATKGNFRSTMRAQPDLYVIMGNDQFQELETWKEADELTRLCSIIVHTRLGEKQPGAELPFAVLSRFGYIRRDDFYVHPSGHTVNFVSTTFFPISATLIRRKVAAGESIRYLVPTDVADYIERHALY